MPDSSPLEDFAGFAAELRTEDGTPFELQEFQRTALGDYFDGARSTVILLPKKNGKTTLIAALALYHLLTTPNAECIMVAASREQAEIILRQARMFVRGSDDLSRLMTIQQRTILLNEDEGRIRVLASDVDTADGALPTLAIVDELHRHRSLDLYGVMQDGLGPRHGQIITISTAGAAFDSPLGMIRQNAHDMEGFSRSGTYNHVRSPDRAFAYHEWCLDAEADVDDLEVVKTANPAPWQTVQALAERKADPSMTPWRWLRFACGIWTEGEEPWLEPHVWDGLGGMEPLNGEAVWVAVDLGVREEEPAVVRVARLEDGYHIDATILPGTTEVEQVEDVLRELTAVVNVSYDPRQFQRSAEMLGKEGLQMVEFPMTLERMAKASATLWRLIERGELHHSGDRDLRAHVLAGVVKEDGRGWRVQRDPRTRRPVAALMALMMAVAAAEDMPVRELMMSWA